MTIDRLARLEDRMGKVEQEVVATGVEVREARRDISDLAVLIQGPPRDESIRGRLHRLEDSEATAKAANAALTAAKAMYEQSTEKRFSRREKLVGLVFAASMIASVWLEPLIQNTHH